MKATTWLCPVLILLCAIRLVYTAQRGTSAAEAAGAGGSYGVGIGYPLDYMDSNLIQDEYYLSKRNKPSLSIVNPLDVLRQRLLLEIARRQMKENTRQVELNRAILKNVGKRAFSKHSSAYPMGQQWQTYATAQNDMMQREPLANMPHNWGQLQQQQQEQLIPYVDIDEIPTALIFDYVQQQQKQRQHEQQQQLQGPWLKYAAIASTLYDAADGSNNEDANDGEDNDNVANNDLFMAKHGDAGAAKAKQTNEQKLVASMNKPSANRAKNNHEIHLNDLNLNDLTSNSAAEAEAAAAGTLSSAASSSSPASSKSDSTSSILTSAAQDNDANTGDYQVRRYLYHLHKNHFTRK